MKINAYILANRSQGVEPPIPVDPVSATITAGTFYIPYHEIKYDEQSVSCDKTYTCSLTSLNGIQGVPMNWASGTTDFVSLKPDWTRGGVASPCTVMPTKGSFTLNVGSLEPGKYVFEVVHLIGTNKDNLTTTPPKPASKVEVDSVKTRIIKSGTHGQIEAVLNPEQVEYTDGNPTASRNYSCRTIETRVRYGFTIASGDTTKVFEWGAGTDINLNELWSGIKLYAINTDGSSSPFGAWVNARLYFKVTLYTAR